PRVYGRKTSIKRDQSLANCFPCTKAAGARDLHPQHDPFMKLRLQPGGRFAGYRDAFESNDCYIYTRVRYHVWWSVGIGHGAKGHGTWLEAGGER
nr:hypothetical protein [Candidatus Sigynarchaeota archaeon]